jgi:hypothetical protein
MIRGLRTIFIAACFGVTAEAQVATSTSIRRRMTVSLQYHF